MNEIQKIAEEARKALENMTEGKTFSSSYVLNRLQKSADKNSGDALICHMRDVIEKRAAGQNFITQKEISEAYNHLYGLSGGRSNFRQELGDLLPTRQANAAQDPKGISAARVPYDEKLSPLYEDSELSKELSGVFSLEQKSAFSTISDSIVKKAEKFAKLQMIALGCPPTEVKAIRTNEHFILCNASIDTSGHTQVNVPIPVQVTNGMPSLPQSFVQGNQIVKLNKENLYVFIKDKNNFVQKVARDRFQGQRAFGEVQVDAAVVPASLERFTNLENALVAAATSFSRDQVRVATNVVAMEFASLGVPNPQIRVASSTDKSLTFFADIPTVKGRVEASVSVDMPNGRPVIPAEFLVAGNSYRLDKSGLQLVLGDASTIGGMNKVSREVEEMSRLSYSQLIDQVDSGVANRDYKQAEDAVSVIGQKFGGEQHIAALDRFSRLLKHSTGSTERDALIKAALDNGDLIKVQTSVQLYCPKLGLPVSKVAFDTKGRPIPMSRSRQSGALSDTGAMISTSKISLS